MNGNTDRACGFTGRAGVLFIAANFALIAGFAIELGHLVPVNEVPRTGSEWG